MLKFDLKKWQDEKLLCHFQGEIQLDGICAVFGDSGAGKTTFVRSIAGLDKGFSGFLHCQEKVWLSDSVFIKTEKRNIGMVFQEPRLFPHLDALGNLQIAQEKATNPLYSIKQLAEQLDFIDLLSKKTHQLSGGQKQRIAIARAILTAPDLLIMDEPLSSLDQHSRQLLLPFLKKLGSKIPIIYITHAMQEVFYLSQQMVLINKSKVEAIGTPQTLFLDPCLSLVKHAHSGLLLDVDSLTWDEQFSLSYGLIDGQAVVLAIEKNNEKSLQIKVESKDVIIATERLGACSLQNCLCVKIEAIKTLSANSMLLTLTTGKQMLLAKITVKSFVQLNLHKGQSVFAYIKALSIFGSSL